MPFRNDEYVLELLARRQIVSSQFIEEARQKHEHYKNGVVSELIAQNVVDREKILRLIAEDCELEFVQLIEVYEDGLLEGIQKEEALRHSFFPLKIDGEEVFVAVADPFNLNALDRLQHRFGRVVRPVVVPRENIIRTILKHYSGQNSAKEIIQESTSDENAENPLIELVHQTIDEAAELSATDIHMEPMRDGLRIRYRIDGLLRTMRSFSPHLQHSVINRIKIMSNMDIAEKRFPQDGRFSYSAKKSGVMDVRVSSIPTTRGEGMVLRLLDKSRNLLNIDQLGFSDDDLKNVLSLLSQPDGMVIVAGPTGCGKTTTLYAFLNELNQKHSKIITVEDPIEYSLLGINQIQTSPDIGFSFATALRSILRQSPNIIMVGEIRDQETAQIAVQATLTGHLVLTTLHTHDTVSAFSRLFNLSIPFPLLASVVQGVVSQRLVRKICPNCFRKNISDCGYCGGNGYRGRKGIFEFLMMQDDLRQNLQEAKDVSQIKNLLREWRPKSLMEDGLQKVEKGETSFEEVLRVTEGIFND